MKKLACFLGFVLLGASTPFAQNVQPEPARAEATAANKKLYNFTFVDTDYEAVFRSISVTAGIDVLLAPDVKGKMSLKVTKKTWQETLDIICEMYELTWLVQDKYISIQRSAAYQAKQKKLADAAEQAAQVAPLVRRNFSVQHAKADELVKVLESMKSNRGKLTTVDRTNSIIVYDTEASIAQMDKALQELDVETLQIMISAKLVVVSSDLSRELGVDWSTSMGSTALTPGVASTGTPGVGTRISAAARQNGSASAINGPGSVAISASVLDNRLGVAIANLMGDASTEILASPQISTLDNTEATVYMGDKISIRVIDDNGESSTQLVETGIKLTVTPHVSGDNRILLDLHPEDNSYGYDEKGEVVISTQEAKTKIVVADGETAVIGGLTRNENTESESGIPFLKDIPLLGNLFKYTRHAVAKKDLIIFVTPRIIRNHVGDVQTSEPSELVAGEAPEAKPVEQEAPAAEPVAQPTPQEAPAAKPVAQPAPQEAPAAEPVAQPAPQEAPAAAPVAQPAPQEVPAAPAAPASEAEIWD